MLPAPSLLLILMASLICLLRAVLWELTILNRNSGGSTSCSRAWYLIMCSSCQASKHLPNAPWHAPATFYHVQAWCSFIRLLKLPLIDGSWITFHTNTFVHNAPSRAFWDIISFLIAGDAQGTPPHVLVCGMQDNKLLPVLSTTLSLNPNVAPM